MQQCDFFISQVVRRTISDILKVSKTLFVPQQQTGHFHAGLGAMIARDLVETLLNRLAEGIFCLFRVRANVDYAVSGGTAGLGY